MRANYIILVISLSLAGCGPSQQTLDATATAVEAGRLLAVQHYQETQSADATHWAEATPRPTATPDTRPESEKRFDRCVHTSEIIYVIKGNNVSAVSVTLENDTNGTEQGDYKLPFCIPYSNFKSGDFLYISAQIIQGNGNIECVIYDGDKVIAQSRASGRASIATCSGKR